MANHINHYKSLKKKTHKIKKRGNSKALFNLPSTLFALFFVLFFSFFCCSFFYNDSIFFLSSPSFLGLCCCLLLLPSFEFHTKTIFSPFLLFSTFVQTFSQLICMCVTFSFTSHPSQLPYHLCAVFIFFCSLSVCVFNEYCSFVSQSFVWLPESSRYSCHDVCLKHLNCTVLYWNRQKLDLMELLHL